VCSFHSAFPINDILFNSEAIRHQVGKCSIVSLTISLFVSFLASEIQPVVKK